jgi:hypothetical protein
MTIGKLCVGVWLCAILTLPAAAGVSVTSPTGSTSASPVHFVASGSSPACAKGVAAMGVYTAPGVLAYVANGSKLDTNLGMAEGSYQVVVQQWDNCGSAAKSYLKLSVSGSTASSGGGKTFSNLQKGGGWTGYALLPPSFGICSGCTPNSAQAKWSWVQNVGSPSLDGAATKASYGGGSTRWADILWNNHLIGDFSSQGLPDRSRTLVASLHNFTYDVYFWISNTSDSQALEFDINQFFGGKSYIWGHECRIDGGHEWDTWSNPKQHWVPSGVACKPVSNAWNHLTINVQRTSNGQLLFHTITLNGKTATLNRTDSPTASSWYGITVNYQMDSDYSITPYPVYLDKLTFTAQ